MPSNLRALADRIAAWQEDDTGGYDQAIALVCEAETVLRACADAQERQRRALVIAAELLERNGIERPEITAALSPQDTQP